jgi:hypothetical protein
MQEWGLSMNIRHQKVVEMRCGSSFLFKSLTVLKPWNLPLARAIHLFSFTILRIFRHIELERIEQLYFFSFVEIFSLHKHSKKLLIAGGAKI